MTEVLFHLASVCVCFNCALELICDSVASDLPPTCHVICCRADWGGLFRLSLVKRRRGSDCSSFNEDAVMTSVMWTGYRQCALAVYRVDLRANAGRV